MQDSEKLKKGQFIILTPRRNFRERRKSGRKWRQVYNFSQDDNFFQDYNFSQDDKFSQDDNKIFFLKMIFFLHKSKVALISPRFNYGIAL